MHACLPCTLFQRHHLPVLQQFPKIHWDSHLSWWQDGGQPSSWHHPQNLQRSSSTCQWKAFCINSVGGHRKWIMDDRTLNSRAESDAISHHIKVNWNQHQQCHVRHLKVAQKAEKSSTVRQVGINWSSIAGWEVGILSTSGDSLPWELSSRTTQ